MTGTKNNSHDVPPPAFGPPGDGAGRGGRPNPHDHRHFNRKRLVIAIIITFITLILEILGGIFTNSLALLSDAAHMFSHLFSLGISYIAIMISARPARPEMTYGYYRSEILAAFVNGLTLFIIVATILYGALDRFRNPLDIKSTYMFVVAAIGLLVNIVTALLLHSGSREDINIKGAFLHALGDTISSVGVVVAAVLIYLTRLYIFDTLVSILIAVIIVYWAISLIKDSGHILLEGIPRTLNLEAVKTTIKKIIERPSYIHHVHVWQISTNIYAFTAHITIDHYIDQNETTRYLQTIKKELDEKFNIHHTTIQFECKPCDETG